MRSASLAVLFVVGSKQKAVGISINKSTNWASGQVGKREIYFPEIPWVV
jgi:hypothetical protein